MQTNKRGSIALSIETIVIVIISLVILTSGIVLLKSFISGAEQTQTLLDQKTEAELERLLVDEGKQVALPRNVVSLERGMSHIFGVGILNTDSEKTKDKFKIELSLNRAVDVSNQPLEANPSITENWFLYDNSAFSLSLWENRKESLSVTIPKDAPSGEYIFDVKILCGENVNEKYGNTQKVVISVK
jgi:hypothetical protein